MSTQIHQSSNLLARLAAEMQRTRVRLRPKAEPDQEQAPPQATVKRTQFTHNSEVSDAYTSRAVTAPKAKPDLYNCDSNEFERASAQVTLIFLVTGNFIECLFGPNVCLSSRRSENSIAAQCTRLTKVQPDLELASTDASCVNCFIIKMFSRTEKFSTSRAELNLWLMVHKHNGLVENRFVHCSGRYGRLLSTFT